MPFFMITAITASKIYPLVIRRETVDAAYVAVQQIIHGALMFLTK